MGIITTNPINDSTPAGFNSHQPSRQRYYEIARDLVGSGFDFFAGSGMADPRGKKGNEPDIFGVAREKGYQVVRDRTRFDQLQPGSGKVLAILPISFAIDRKAGEFTLAEIVQTGIRFLEGRE
ncbi:MAG: hypothetical protein NTX88_07620 [Candidatus Atribacteria bacterium]|nr:hypothetical protein [Candidatus Atribacteria bacterium]